MALAPFACAVQPPRSAAVIALAWCEHPASAEAALVQLADALAAGNLDLYETAHRKLAWRPTLVARLLLMLDGRAELQGRALRYLSRHPGVFRFLLAWHVGELRNPIRVFDNAGLAGAEGGK